MQTTAYAVPRRPQMRVSGLLFAVLLQVGLVTALVKGLDIKVWPMPPLPPIQVTLPKTDKPPPPPPTLPRDRLPDPVYVPIPDLPPIAGTEGGTGLTPTDPRPSQAGPADHGPLGIPATHTIPPYPPLDMRLGHEGTVVLRLTISAEGRVTEAIVVRSSGSESLDNAARSWVMAHWRYQPAIRGGVAVPATGTVGVQFNLRQAG